MEWLITEGLNYFRARLANRAQERLNKIKAPTAEPVDLMQALKDSLVQRTPDGGIPLVPAKEGA